MTRTTQPKPRRAYNDQYDVGSEGFEVHSSDYVPELNADYKLWNPAPELASNRPIKFVCSRMQTAKIMASNIPDKTIRKHVLRLLLLQVHTLITNSVSLNATALKAVLGSLGKGDESDSEKDATKTIKKLFSEKKTASEAE